MKVPLLIVPPWINKFYILDLTPEKSFIKWCVDQGISVFVVSWVNPDARLAAKSFEEYMKEGVIAALDAVEEVTGESQVNAIGYCVGGTLLAITLAYLAAKKTAKQKDRVLSATLFAAQVDFTYAGDLMVFVDKERIAQLEEHMKEQGYLEASRMATAFNMLRSNDSDLALRGQQLHEGQEALPVRHPLLEFRRHPHAGGQSSVLFAQLLSRQQSDQGQDGNRRRHARPAAR